MKNLTVKRIERLSAPGRYTGGTVLGLCFLIGKDGARMFVLRYYVFFHFEQDDDQWPVSVDQKQQPQPAATSSLPCAARQASPASLRGRSLGFTKVTSSHI